MSRVRASVKTDRNIRARATPAPAQNLENLTNVDSTELETGSVIVYNTNTSKWKTTRELNNQSIDCGEF